VPGHPCTTSVTGDDVVRAVTSLAGPARLGGRGMGLAS
jgi:hypothetical protein